MGCAVRTEPQAHTSHLIIYVVLVGMVLVKDQFKELSHSIYIDRLELPGFAACLFIITERDIAERKATDEAVLTKPSHAH